VPGGGDAVHTTAEPPLVVDLDGTLLRTDSLYESTAVLLRQRPSLLFALPAWLRRGRAALKRQIAERVDFDPRHMPFDAAFLDYLNEERTRRRIILCTAADRRVAGAVAAHFGLFDDVIATDGDVNLAAHSKRDELVRRFGMHGFDYAGNATPDIPVFAVARRAIAVNPTPALRRRLRQVPNLTRTFTSDGATVLPWIRTLRPERWLVNVVAYLPLLPAGGMTRGGLNAATLTFLALGLLTSGVHVLHDIVSLPADRAHPLRRTRPLAAGLVELRAALLLGPLLIATGFAIAALLSVTLAAVVLAHGVVLALYLLHLAQVPLLRPLGFAALLALAGVAGTIAVGATPF
jgi:phosphoserine phosphatase